MKKIFGIIGEKLSHTFSPKIHERIFDEIKLDGNYCVFEVEKERLCNVVDAIKALSIKGINVTIPYKVDIIKYLDELSEEARKIGAVNVVNIKENKAIGYNTDYYGFGMTLDKFEVDIKNKGALILGTGGVSRSVVQYLEDNGIGQVVFAARDILKAKEKYSNYNIISYKEINDVKDCSLIINCTPVGMYPDINCTPVNKVHLSKFETAMDLIYNPRETLFLKDAKEHGLKTINGMYMLVGQAIKSQEIWNNIRIPVDIVDNIYNDLLMLLE